MKQTRPRKRSSGGGTASAIVLRPLLAFAESEGGNAAEILAELGLPAAAIGDYDERIPEQTREAAWALATRAATPYFGLRMAQTSVMGTYDVLDYSLYYSATLGHALAHLLRFSRVICDAWALQRESDARTTRLHRRAETCPPEAEFFFALIVLRARSLTEVAVIPREVRFAHAPPKGTKLHAALFGCPVHFGCAKAELIFRTKDLALPVTTANRGVELVLERYMTEIVSRLPKGDSFLERVRAAVGKALRNGRPTLEMTARALGASPRTVQRKLGEIGTRHLDVVDGVRRELAERLVADGNVSITEIAFLLGFADLTGFTRVYKRWTGMTPSQSRKTPRGDASGVSAVALDALAATGRQQNLDNSPSSGVASQPDVSASGPHGTTDA